MKNKNATYLTEKYPGAETNLWSQCIYSFLNGNKPELPISKCISNPVPNAAWFESRSEFPKLNFTEEIIPINSPNDLEMNIESRFNLSLKNDKNRYVDGSDILGIIPDFIMCEPKNRILYLIENKPYFHSTLTGNQSPNGAYIHFIKLMEKLGIRCEYIIIVSISHTTRLYRGFVSIQNELANKFGLLFLEDIFSQMNTKKYEHDKIQEKWIEYSEKGDDYRNESGITPN